MNKQGISGAYIFLIIIGIIILVIIWFNNSPSPTGNAIKVNDIKLSENESNDVAPVSGEVIYDENNISDNTPIDSGNQINDMFNDTNKLHWPHMPLIYEFNGTRCQGVRYDKLMYAFNEIKTETNDSVYFIESSGSETPDLIINCLQVTGGTTYEEDYSTEKLGEGGVNWYAGNIIINASVDLYSTQATCGYFPFIEIHEILHAFNYSHVDKMSSIMYPNTDHCTWAYDNVDLYGPPSIDKNIIQELDEIYGQNKTINSS